MQLIINSPGASLRKADDRMSIQEGSKQFAVSCHKLQTILVTTAVFLFSGANELGSLGAGNCFLGQ